jgi:hypothetical protein
MVIAHLDVFKPVFDDSKGHPLFTFSVFPFLVCSRPRTLFSFSLFPLSTPCRSSRLLQARADEQSSHGTYLPNISTLTFPSLWPSRTHWRALPPRYTTVACSLLSGIALWYRYPIGRSLSCLPFSGRLLKDDMAWALEIPCELGLYRISYTIYYTNISCVVTLPLAVPRVVISLH